MTIHNTHSPLKCSGSPSSSGREVEGTVVPGKPCRTAFTIRGMSASVSGGGWVSAFVELTRWRVIRFGEGASVGGFWS